MTITVGIDIGSGAVKTRLFRRRRRPHEWLAQALASGIAGADP